MPNNFTVNFYEVLGVEHNAPMKEIKKQYGKLVVKYHPDKVKDTFEASLFEIIQRAYETLGNEEKRKEYDFFLKNLEMSKKNDHNSLKANYEKFKDLMDVQPKSKDTAQVEFDKVFKEMDSKHGFDRTALDEKLDKDSVDGRLDDLILQREQDEIEFTQNTIFDNGENFDISKFNAAFDMYKNTSDKQITKKSNVQAFNFSNELNGFSTLDVYDKTYDEESTDGTNAYSNVNIGKKNKINKDKIKNIHNADYTLGHNKLEDNYEDEIQKRLRERELETDNLSNIKYSEFKNEDKAFQFSHEIGITENMLDWENDEDLAKACQKLIELEKVKDN